MIQNSKPKKKIRALFIVTFLPFVLAWVIDWMTKDWSSQWTSSFPIFFGPVHLMRTQNYGLASGLYSETSPLLREVSLATIAAFLLFIYLMVQFLIPARQLTFRVGLSLLMGGILGNVTDRMSHGSVTDFINVGNALYSTPVFNGADFFQWVGYLLIAYSIIRYRDRLWRQNELRQSYWVNLDFQLSYCLSLVGCGLGFALISGAFTFAYFKIAIGSSWAQILIPYFSVFSLVTVAFLIVLFIFGMILSHRIAGPVYAFERFLKEVHEGKSPSFKLRPKDQFKHLEELALRIKKEKGLRE